MHRTGNLWERVTAFDNLHCAAYQVLRGKRAKQHAGDFFLALEHNLLQLQDALRQQTYQPGSYRSFWISDPKLRLISASPFRDRVVHHALVNSIEPVFERRFIHHSYACRVGKGTHRALQQFVTWGHTSRYVLKLDIHKFFPTIDHALLKAQLQRSIKDPYVLWLCELIIDHSNQQEPVQQYFPTDDIFTPLERRHGIPIGNLTSQFFANVYLDSLDHFIKQQLGAKRYLRYADDFCCFHNDKHVLTEWRAAIVEFLAGLRLQLNAGKSRVRQIKEGVEFLGFVVFPDQLRLNHTATRRQRRRQRALQAAYAAGLLSWKDVAASLRAWQAHANQGTTRRLQKDVLEPLVFRRSSELLPRDKSG